MFKKYMLICLLAIVSAFAAPQNNSYQQQSSWNGWGGLVDWSFRSLRVGSTLEDSLLDDGWLLADSGRFSYMTVDSFLLDSLDLTFIHALYGDIDTLAADSIEATNLHASNGIFAFLASLDSLNVTGESNFETVTVNNSLVTTKLYLSSIESSNTHVDVLDSLLTGYIGATGSISATNNVSANDLVAADSGIVNTLNSAYTVRAGTDITAWASSVYLSRTVSRNGYLYSCYSPLSLILYGTSFTLIGHPAFATSIPTYVISDFMTGLYYLDQSPDFASTSGWVLSGTSISGGKLNKLTAAGAGTATSTAISNYPIVSGATYLLHVDVDSVSTGDSILVTMGGATFGYLDTEGSNQWFRATTVNNSSVFSIAWDDTETGILDNVYVYRVAGDFTVGGEVWGQSWNKKRDYAVLEGDHILTMTCADTNTVTLPEMAGCWNNITSTGREVIIENQGPEICIVTTPPTDDALNAILGGDTLHLARYQTATLRAVTSSHWAVLR